MPISVEPVNESFRTSGFAVSSFPTADGWRALAPLTLREGPAGLPEAALEVPELDRVAPADLPGPAELDTLVTDLDALN